MPFHKLRFHLYNPQLVNFLVLTISELLTGSALGQDKPGWKMIWSDEFTTASISTSKWTLSNGAANVNSELEYYSNSAKNAFIDSGSLVLRALKEDVGGKNYTSGKLTSQRKGDWLYGRVEVRAKLNRGKGMWPAIWMMPTDEVYGDWPFSGEMDIMELLGDQPAKVYGTIHWDSNGHQQQGSSKTISNGTFADDYHVFGYEWDVGQQRWYIDDALYFSTTKGQPFDKRFFLILNVAVGGDWPGNPDGTTVFPNDMYIDYVRVYEKNGTGFSPLAEPNPGIKIIANPLQGETIVGDALQESDFLIHDLFGRVLLRQHLSMGQKYDLGNKLPKGIYFLETISGGDRHVTKIYRF